MPVVSASWKASLPMRWVGTWPEKQTKGIESIRASVRPVTALVTPRPGGDKHAADLAGAPRIALGGMDGGLFVAHQDVAQAVEAVEHVVDRQHRPAGVAEYMLHPVVHHGAEHHLRADHLLARLLKACVPLASTRAQSGGGKRRGSRRAGGGGARPAPPVAGAAGVLEAGRHGRLGGAEGGRGEGTGKEGTGTREAREAVRRGRRAGSRGLRAAARKAGRRAGRAVSG